MALDTFNPPVAPSPGTSRKPELKLLKAEFGDGYSQVAGDGLNHMRRVIDVRWDVLTQAQATAITSFLEGKAGVEPFLYRHPHAPAAIKVTCEEWSVTDAAKGLSSLTATFRQSFNLAT